MYFYIILERRQVLKMLKFEVKKVFSKPKNKIAVMLLFVVLVVTSILTINRVEYVDENGNHSVGIKASRNLRETKNKWAGYLTEDTLRKALEENTTINNSKEAMSEDIAEQDKAYAKYQGIAGIIDIINSAFSEFRDYNPYAANSVSADEVGTVYERRLSTLKNWMNSGEETYTEEEQKFLIQQYEKLKTPFYYEYADGWAALLQNISTFILILALIIGFFVSGIFSDEFQTKADSIFFSSKLGRNKGVLSKMGAGMMIVSVFYIVFVVLYTAIVLFVLGADGANCPIQLDLWRSVYNVTFLQAYLFIVLGGYVGTLFASLLAMLVSSVTRSTTTAIIVPFIILCAFPFLSRIITLPQLCLFFPDQLLEVYVDMKESGLVNLGGKVTTVAAFIIPLYTVICLILQPILYRSYSKAEVK
jgi:ABC-type transport system involved in multi-copper enzyme maturation permease subunit